MLTGIFSIFGLYYEDDYSVRKINTYLVRLLYFLFLLENPHGRIPTIIMAPSI